VAAGSPETYTVLSPNDRLEVRVSLDADGVPRYAVSLDGADVVEPSLLGLWFQSRIDLVAGLRVTGVERRSVDSTWEQPWGERRLVTDRHNELLLRLAARTPDRQLALRFRVFDDGVGFRYEVPDQEAYSDVRLVGERTEFRVSRDARAFSQPANGEMRYEQLYTESPVGVLDLVSTPLTLRLDSGVHLAIHEAALVDYPAYSLEFDVDSVFRTRLRPSSAGYRAILNAPFVTPWRTIQVADNAVGLVNSSLILNLNEPAVLDDTSWIEPGKYVGIWWAMHRGEKTWSSGPRHGATTAEARRYIDFAARHGFDGVLVEGWNRGWDGDWIENSQFSFTEAQADFDIDAVSAYARERGVRLIGHHETGGHASDYEAELDEAFALYEALGVRQVKTGYVGKAGTMKRKDASGEVHLEWHDSQFAVNHHQRVVEVAARHRIAIDTHEPVKDTGLRRTWPNWLTREGSRGMEFNIWGETPNPAGHEAMLAFTRMLAGPMDYTPGIFDLEFDVRGEPRRIRSTLAKQLALYVVLYSPIQMVADLPENYASRPDAFRFIVDVPTDWEESLALAGAVGEFIVTARRERQGTDWYLGAVTDAHPRRLSVSLDFLEPGRDYVAEIYADGADADWQTNPYAIDISTREYTRSDTLELKLAAGGGAAIRFRPVT
jgi:alpha-glucosidase